MSENLTTLAALKSWVKVTGTEDDPILTRLVASASSVTLRYLSRPSLVNNEYTEIFGGGYKNNRPLRYWPVNSLSSVQIGTVVVPVSPQGQAPSYGYRIVPWDGYLPGLPAVLSLLGYEFSPVAADNQVVYSAGYLSSGEAWIVPAASGPYTVAPDYTWLADSGVTYANGTPLTKVTSNPTIGHYVAPAATGGSYTFAAADAGAALLGSYSFVPPDVEQVVIEVAGERYSYRSRIGQRTRALGGQETASYDLSDLPAWAKTALQPYRSVYTP